MKRLLETKVALVSVKNSENMDTPSLSKGALLKICQGGRIDKPTLQILRCKKVVVSKSDQYMVTMSDGEFASSYVLLDTELHHLITEGKLSDATIVCLTNYVCKKQNNKKIIDVLDLEILKPGSAVLHMLGDTVPIKADGTVNITFKIIPASWGKNNEMKPNPNMPVKYLTVPNTMSFHDVYLFAAEKFKVSCLNSVITTPNGDMIDFCQSAGKGFKKYGSDLLLCHKTFKDLLWKDPDADFTKGAIPRDILKGFKKQSISLQTVRAICLGIEELQGVSVISSSDISHHTCQALNRADIFPSLNVKKEEMLSIYINNKLFPMVLLINKENLQIFEYLTNMMYLYYNNHGDFSNSNPPLNPLCMIRTGRGRRREEKYYWRGLTVGYGEEYQEGCQYPKEKVEVYLIDLGFSISIPKDDPRFDILPMPPAGGKIPPFKNPQVFLTIQAAFERWLLHPASVHPVSRLQGKWNRFRYEGSTQVILEETLTLTYPSPLHIEEVALHKDKFITKTKLPTSETPTVSTYLGVFILLC